MTPSQLEIAGIRLFGRRHWKAKMAHALAVDVSTIHRIGKRAEVPGPYEVAIKGLLENKKQIDAAAATARKLGLVPRKRRKKVLVPRGKKPRHPKKEKSSEEVRDRIVSAGNDAADSIASD